MDSEFVLFPPQASTLAPKIDAVFFYILSVAVFFTVLIAVLLLYFAIKYRRRSNSEIPRPIEGSLRLEIVWTAIPLVLALSMFAWSASVYYEIVTPPPDTMEVYVVAKQWMWELQHAGGQREINQLHIPLGKPVKLTMTSQDVIHSFFVPEFRVKQDVLPGRYTNLWFEATQTGKFHLFCAEYCGTNHSTMIGKVIVMEPTRFEKWLAEHPDGSLAAKGRHLFYNLQCMTCHSDAQAKAPRLQGLYGKTVTLDDGSEVTADEDYLRESIVNPRAKVVAPYRPIMPPYQLSEEKLTQLVVFLKSLRADDPLPRYERREPPLVQPP
jgi:cytochrome c oxidase subunit II